MMWLVSNIAIAGILPDGVKSKQLPNGLTAVVVPLAHSNVVAVQTWMRVGSRNETQPGTTGYAHFFEHLMFYGTAKYSRDERKNELMLLGVEENAWTSADMTCYHLLGEASGVDKILEIEADRFQHLQLKKEMIQRESGAVLGEFRKGRNSPSTLLYEKMLAAAFIDHGYGHSTIGYERDVKAMPTGQKPIAQFYRDHYRPENAVVVVAGGIQADKTMVAIERTFGKWKSASEPVVAPPPVQEAVQKAPRKAAVVWNKSDASPLLMIGYKIPSFSPEQAAKLSVMAELLTVKSGQLWQGLVAGAKAPALSFSVRANERIDPGLLTFSVRLKKQADFTAVKKQIKLAIERLKTADQSTVNAAKNTLLRRQVLRLQSPERWASRVGWYTTIGGEIQSFERYLVALKAVSAADIQQVTRQLLVPNQSTTVQLVAGGKQ